MPRAGQPPKKAEDTPIGAPEPSGGAPSVRLAIGCSEVSQVGGFINKALATKDPPTIRLAATIHSGATSPEQFDRALQSPKIHLAHVPGAQGDNVLAGRHGVKPMGLVPGGVPLDDSLPALLVSFFYLPAFLENRHRYHFRDWVMDSGAFSAHNSGAAIDLQEYIEQCHELMAVDPTLTEIFALDEIGSWQGTVKNTEEMWRAGIPAIPCFHYGEPWDVLKGMCRDYPKVAIGGCVGKRDKNKFAGECFAREWPKPFHGFGFGSEDSIMMYPFHSTDATNWEMGPARWGHWKAFGGQRVSVRGSKQNLRSEVEWYLDLEKRARVRWKKEMEVLRLLGPTVRLAEEPNSRQAMKAAAFAPRGERERESPEVRLAIATQQGGPSDLNAKAFKKQGDET